MASETGIAIVLFGMMGLFVCFGYMLQKTENFFSFLCWLFYAFAIYLPSYGLRIMIEDTNLSADAVTLLNTLYILHTRLLVTLTIFGIVYLFALFLGWTTKLNQPAWKKKRLNDRD
jgi:phosphoglycerol transferase MdoB-like AlkP superfamily enzyme